MADSPREQLDALKRQVDREAPLSPEPLLANAAEQGRHAANLAGEIFGEQAEILASHVRARPLTAISLGLLGGYVLGRLGRWL